LLTEADSADTNLVHIKIITLAFKNKQANTKVTTKNNSLTKEAEAVLIPKNCSEEISKLTSQISFQL